MKTLKTIVLGFVIVMAFGSAKAYTVKVDNENLTIAHAVNTYINAMVHGKVGELDAVLDQDVKFSMLRGKQVMTFTKDQILELAKTNENVNQNCTVTASTRESNNDITVVQVDMNYSTFTRTNYVTLANTGNGWKITSVYSVFK